MLPPRFLLLTFLFVLQDKNTLEPASRASLYPVLPDMELSAVNTLLQVMRENKDKIYALLEKAETKRVQERLLSIQLACVLTPLQLFLQVVGADRVRSNSLKSKNTDSDTLRKSASSLGETTSEFSVLFFAVPLPASLSAQLSLTPRGKKLEKLKQKMQMEEMLTRLAKVEEQLEEEVRAYF